jgi:hypothetical protein
LSASWHGYRATVTVGTSDHDMSYWQTTKTEFGPLRGRPSLRALGNIWMGRLRHRRDALCVGEKPRGLGVSNRAWRRNSALVMAIYEQHGRDR